MAGLKRRLKFTDAFVRTAKPETYTDIVQTGLRLRVSPKGLRTFFHLYRLHGVGKIGTRGKRGVGMIRKDVLGHYPGLSLEDARKLVKETSEKVRAGIDPREMPVRGSDGPTFADVAAKALADNTDRTRDKDVPKYLLPILGTRPVDQITRKEMAGVLDKIECSKSPSRITRLMVTLRLVFKVALEHGYIDNDPMYKMKRGPKPNRRLETFDDDELLKMWEFADGDPGHSAALQLLILTGQRKGETSVAKWDDFDLETGIWTIPWQTRKRKPPPDHIVYLPRAAVAVLTKLKDARKEDAGPFVFTVSNGRRRANAWRRFVVRLNEATGVFDKRPQDENKRCIHTLRHTAGTGMEKLGVFPHVVSRVFSHSLGETVSDTTQTYLHGDLADPKREALQRWADHLFPPTDDTVVRLTEKRKAS